MFLIRRDETPGPEAEALAAYIDGLLRGDTTATAPDPGLADLAARARTELRSAEPSTAFVSGLHLRLVAAANQRAPLEEAVAAWRQPRFILGAAGLVSAAAVLAFVARSRMQIRAA